MPKRVSSPLHCLTLHAVIQSSMDRSPVTGLNQAILLYELSCITPFLLFVRQCWNSKALEFTRQTLKSVWLSENPNLKQKQLIRRTLYSIKSVFRRARVFISHLVWPAVKELQIWKWQLQGAVNTGEDWNNPEQGTPLTGGQVGARSSCERWTR